ncbi:MAG: ABC-F family ATP-binding cassette domain-containing protein [Bacteroidales bacterium]|nr:ABC-F family ATP-binding cassette domain-containing protein [Bacteroidales bacterium]
MISVNNVSVQFSGEYLFDHVSFILNEKDRIGLVGKNGAGKSTLLRIIKGIQQPDEGDIISPDGCTIGYLPQEMTIHSTRPVYDEAKSAFLEVESLKKKIEQLEAELDQRRDFSSAAYQHILRIHHDAYERYHLIGGQTAHIYIEKTLTGLGFDPAEFTRPLKEFSSGWRMRVEIAKILLQQPDLILLDEPTNHLDIESIQWLESFLINYHGIVVLVSHDRALLDNVTRRTIEISLGKIYDYKSNYSGYIEMREERMESQLATYNNQQRQIRQVERFIERFRYKATKSSQVQSRIKMLEKIDPIEIDRIDESGIFFTFPPAPHSGKIILEAQGLGKCYSTKNVLTDLTFQVIKGDRIAFVGKNGEGKTTLSKIIAGQLDYTGTLKHGHNVILGYYAQDQADYLDPNKTVFQTIDDIAVGDIRPRIRTILGNFLFSGETIDKKVKVLSGGEKSRLSLARLLLTPCNLLVLDEPTNHLDMRSKDILKNALLQFTGTIILVSHDRDFLQGLSNRVFEFKNHVIKEYIGDIYDFLYQRNMETLRQLELTDRPGTMTTRSDSVSDNKLGREKKKAVEREVRKVKTQIERREQEIDHLDQLIREKEYILGNPEQFIVQIGNGELYSEYEALKSKLAEVLNEWERLHDQLEAISHDEASP